MRPRRASSRTSPGLATWNCVRRHLCQTDLREVPRGHDSVRGRVKAWKQGTGRSARCSSPCISSRGEAFQSDRGEETLILGGQTTKVSIAHFRLCRSRLPICIAYLRECLEMVMYAQRQALAFFGGVCRRGI